MFAHKNFAFVLPPLGERDTSNTLHSLLKTKFHSIWQNATKLCKAKSCNIFVWYLFEQFILEKYTGILIFFLSIFIINPHASH